jgi:tRNA-specific 2-thiouridylase
MLHHQGYEVVGITLQLYDAGQVTGKSKTCCAGQDIQDAKRVAETIGFRHYTLDYETRFRQEVIDDFADSYLRGETPIPCVNCNRTVKFRDLLKTARDLGGAFLATGHYVQRIDNSGRIELHRGANPAKDQSYFLFGTTQEQLDYLRFPLGHMTKEETRALATQYGLAIADKPDSQDICFVPTGDYAGLLQKLRPDSSEPGEIVHQDGRILGTHQGIIHFTVGQRRGLALGHHEPFYVLRLEPDTRRVIVGPKEALAQSTAQVRDINWLGDTPLGDAAYPVEVKIRSMQATVPATITASGVLTFAESQYGVSPGQAAVFYDGARVLGGGWLARQ